MCLKKQYLKNKPVCRVTFQLPGVWGNIAQRVQVLGDFNDWSSESPPMERLKDGGFSLTMDLETDRVYEFRYLLDGVVWLNEVEEEGTAATPYRDAVNSKIVL